MRAFHWLFLCCLVTALAAADEFRDMFLPELTTPQRAVEAFWCRGEFGEKLNIVGFSSFPLDLPDQAAVPAPAVLRELFFGSGVAPKQPNAEVACHANLKNLGTALEMYATDFSGQYPMTLQQLAPEYLKQLPHLAAGVPLPARRSRRLSADLSRASPARTARFSPIHVL